MLYDGIDTGKIYGIVSSVHCQKPANKENIKNLKFKWKNQKSRQKENVVRYEVGGVSMF